MPTRMNRTYPGRCLCGAVSYKAAGPPVVVGQCHCDECRRSSGTGHTVGAMFPAQAVALHGEPATYSYVSATGSTVTKAFCAQCGSSVYGTNSHMPNHMTLTMGTMDDAAELDIQVVIFTRDRPHWDRLGPEVMTFETQPDWKPDDD